MNTLEHLDVLIVGAGLSGIGAGCHLQTRLPGQDATRSSRRARRIGGTWDLFRYPGIRSDSDMYTLGYSFRPWTEAKAIADGPSILDYVRETAREHGIDEQIRFGHRVVARRVVDARTRAGPSRPSARDTGETVRLHLQLPASCAAATTATTRATRRSSRAASASSGQIVHPQHWPEDLDYAGKRVVVIGSGATAVTLVPAMAETAAHVTMLQRSPTYIVSLPAEDPIAQLRCAASCRDRPPTRRALEERAAHDARASSSAGAGRGS